MVSNLTSTYSTRQDSVKKLSKETIMLKNKSKHENAILYFDL